MHFLSLRRASKGSERVDDSQITALLLKQAGRVGYDALVRAEFFRIFMEDNIVEGLNNGHRVSPSSIQSMTSRYNSELTAALSMINNAISSMELPIEQQQPLLERLQEKARCDAEIQQQRQR